MPWTTGRARVSWWGHATVLIDDGARILTDPLLKGSLAHLVRLRGLDPDLDHLTPDAVVVSHLHADHLSVASLRLLPPGTVVLVPRGAARFLRRTPLEVVEVVAGDRHRVGPTTVHVTEAKHDGRRWHGSRMWAPTLGYVVEGERRTYFAGDTALFDAMAGIPAIAGGPLDLALLPVWGWGPNLRGDHLDPATAAEALAMLQPRVAVPIHWGTFWPRGMSRLRKHVFAGAGERFALRAALTRSATEIRVLAPGSSTVV